MKYTSTRVLASSISPLLNGRGKLAAYATPKSEMVDAAADCRFQNRQNQHPEVVRIRLARQHSE